MFVSNTTWTFWNVFFLMFVWIPLTIVWVFAIFDVFRQHALSGLAKAAWLVLIVILPLIGTLCYLIFRPADALAYGDATQAGYYGRPASSK